MITNPRRTSKITTAVKVTSSPQEVKLWNPFYTIITLVVIISTSKGRNVEDAETCIKQVVNSHHRKSLQGYG